MTNLTNAERAEARARILAKLDVDDVVNSGRNLSFGDKARMVDQVMKDIRSDSVIDNFVQTATTKQKAAAVQNIINQLRTEKINQQSDKDKKKVDRDVEKSRNKPGTLKKTYSQKAAEYDDLQKFNQRQKKAADEIIKRADLDKKKVDRDVERNAGLTGDVFQYTKMNNPSNNIDTYKQLMHRYKNINTSRRYVETEQRVRYEQPVVGSFFSFRYDAKTKDKLPKFDASPLIYVLNNSGDRFLGVNFHYLQNTTQAFSLIDDIESGNTNIQFPDYAYHTYLMDSEYLISDLYHIQNDEIRTALLLPLVRWVIR
jgi:hypothetical protein